MGDLKNGKDEFIKLANAQFDKEDVYLRVTYTDSVIDNKELQKDISRFYKMPLNRGEYSPTYQLYISKELVKMIYFEEITGREVFWFLVNKDFAWCY